MAHNDVDKTFNGYVAAMLVGGLCAATQIGVVGLLIAATAIYSGSCLVGGMKEQPVKRKRK